jgi:hypothetical protein
MANNKRVTVRMKPKGPQPPRVDACTCKTRSIMCDCAGTGVSTDWINDDDLKEIKNGNKHTKKK